MSIQKAQWKLLCLLIRSKFASQHSTCHFVILLALLCFLLPLASAQGNDEPHFSFEADFQHFNYREQSDQGKLLDQENGLLPGLLLGMDHCQGAWQIAGQLSYHSGSVTYTGQTNGAEPITTTTQQQIINKELLVGYQLQYLQIIQPTLYVGVANHSWLRNIQPTYTATRIAVRGLKETYHWWQVFLGANIAIYKASSFNLALDTRLAKIVAPTIEVDYSGLYDKSQLDLGERWGYRVALPMSYSLHQSTTLVLEPYIEKFALGRSSSAPLTNQGMIQGTVFEPESSSRICGVMLGLHKLF